MDPKHRQILTRNATMLNADLVVNSDFLSHFEENNVLTPSMIEEIESERTKARKCSVFRGYLPMRGPKAFPTFMKALVETGHDHIAEKLEPGLAAKLIKQRDGDSADSGAVPAPSPGPGVRKVPDKGDGIIDEIDILNVDARTARHILSDTEGVYSMKSRPRGRAIILNNEFFDDLKKEREGSALDATNLENLFQRLYFTPVVWSNLTEAEIWKHIEKEKCHETHKRADAFIFTILSHGNQDTILSTDGKQLSLGKIFEKFDGSMCPSLRGKPKIFFIQACQGGKVCKPLLQYDGDDFQGEPVQETLHTQQSPENKAEVEALVHDKADMIVAFATVQGYKAMRHTQEGTWFIRDLIYTFMERCHQDHLLDMLGVVNQKVGKRVAPGGGVQASEFRLTHNKKLYFLPGYSE